MDIEEFENGIESICANNRWTLEIEFDGVWHVFVYDKDTRKRLGITGMAKLHSLVKVLQIPFSDSVIWY